MRFIKICAALFLVAAFSGCALNGMRTSIDTYRALEASGGLGHEVAPTEPMMEGDAE